MDINRALLTNTINLIEDLYESADAAMLFLEQLEAFQDTVRLKDEIVSELLDLFDKGE